MTARSGKKTFCLDGQHRVKDIKIGGEDIDLKKADTVSGRNFTLCNSGEGRITIL